MSSSPSQSYDLEMWEGRQNQGALHRIFLRIWDKFHAQGIVIPFPQRDLHLKAPSEIRFVSRDPENRPTDSEGGPGLRHEIVTSKAV